MGIEIFELRDLAVLAIIFLLIIIGRWVIRLILQKGLLRLTRHTKTQLDDMIIHALTTPAYWLIVLLAIDIGSRQLSFIPLEWRLTLTNIFFVGYVILAISTAWRLIGGVFDWYGEEMITHTNTDLDKYLTPFFRRIPLVFLLIVGVTILSGRFNIKIDALIATLGIGSLAIALAAQAVFEDTINGFMIMIDKPFRIGDRLEIMALGKWGDVVDIGLRTTRIRTRDNRMVIIPNSVIGKSMIVNYSYPDHEYRLNVMVGISYGSDIELARKTMIEAVREVDGVLKDRRVEALFLEFGDSSLDFMVRWWLDSYIDTRRMYDGVNTAIYKALNEAGITIPFPQRDVNLKLDEDQVDRLMGARRQED